MPLHFLNWVRKNRDYSISTKFRLHGIRVLNTLCIHSIVYLVMLHVIIRKVNEFIAELIRFNVPPLIAGNGHS